MNTVTGKGVTPPEGTEPGQGWVAHVRWLWGWYLGPAPLVLGYLSHCQHVAHVGHLQCTVVMDSRATNSTRHRCSGSCPFTVHYINNINNSSSDFKHATSDVWQEITEFVKAQVFHHPGSSEATHENTDQCFNFMGGLSHVTRPKSLILWLAYTFLVKNGLHFGPRELS